MRIIVAWLVWLGFVVYSIANVAYNALDAYGNADFAANDANWSWLNAATNPWYLVGSLTIVFLGALGFLATKTEWAQTYLQRSSLRVTTEPGNAMLLMVHGEMYCHVKVRNVGELLPSVRARLTKMDALWKGTRVDGTEGYHAMPVSPFQPVYLRWSSRERAKGEHRELLDIPSDKEDHYLDAAVVDASDPDRFSMVTADDKDRRRYGPGWYRVAISVSSTSRYPGSNAREDEYLLGLHPRNATVPAPIVIYPWEPRGRLLMEGKKYLAEA